MIKKNIILKIFKLILISLLRFKNNIILDNQSTQTSFKIPRVESKKDCSFEIKNDPMSSKGTVAKKSIMNQLFT